MEFVSVFSNLVFSEFFCYYFAVSILINKNIFILYFFIFIIKLINNIIKLDKYCENLIYVIKNADIILNIFEIIIIKIKIKNFLNLLF